MAADIPEEVREAAGTPAGVIPDPRLPPRTDRVATLTGVRDGAVEEVEEVVQLEEVDRPAEEAHRPGRPPRRISGPQPPPGASRPEAEDPRGGKERPVDPSGRSGDPGRGRRPAREEVLAKQRLMKPLASSFPGLLSERGSLLVDARLVEQVADLMHDTAFFIKDASGRYLVVNQSLVERHGLREKSQMIGRRPCEICPGDYGTIPTEQDAQVLRTGRPILERLELFWRRPHLPVWGLTSKLPIRDEDGRITGLIGISKELASPLGREEVPPQLAQVLRHLETAYDKPVSPSSLARKGGMTSVRFARTIKRIYGITPMQLITKTRITAGCRLLRETDASIAEIALDCGFSDHSAFTRAFRSVIGMTPSDFRK